MFPIMFSFPAGSPRKMPKNIPSRRLAITR